MARICDLVVAHVKCTSAIACVMDQRSTNLRVIATDTGRGANTTQELGSISCNEICGIPFHCLTSGQAYRCESSEAPPLLQSLTADNTAQFLFAPLINSHRTHGALVLGFAHQTQLSGEEKKILATLASIAAATVSFRTTQILRQQDLRNIRDISCSLSNLGPQVSLQEVKRSIVSGSMVPLGTRLVTLFTIDPCIGGVEAESSAEVGQDLETECWNIYGSLFTGCENNASIQLTILNQDSLGEKFQKVFCKYGITSIAACSIRSEVGASGALVAFYRDDAQCSAETGAMIEAIAGLASSTISYVLAMEQSADLLNDLAGANQKLSVQATMDGLTGLANHRSLQQRLGEMCRKPRSGPGRVFSLVMVDVDHFKMYNDTYGHQEGDAALRQVARTMSSALRQGDFAGRYGGEEFALLLPGVNKESGLEIADRIRRAVANQQCPKGSLTVSMGIAEFPADGDTPSEIIERADRALYHAKITGRNRVFVWGSSSLTDKENTPDVDEHAKTVLVVERADEQRAGMIAQVLSSKNCFVLVSESADEAMEFLKTQTVDIALVSREALPDGDIKRLSQLTAIHQDMPIVLISSDLPVEESREALRRGASDILLRPFNPAELPVVIERNIEGRRLERQRLVQRNTDVVVQAIEALVAAVDAKDPHTAGHSKRVTALALAISDELGISSEDYCALELAAKLHDIGKIALPDSALNKQSPLTEDEWLAMREHPAVGSKIVASIDELAYVSTIIRHHHERLDGTGYPDGLNGPAIPYLARIIAVVDAYEAMTSERAHRSRFTPREAVHELKRHAGTYYSEEVVNALENYLLTSGDMSEKTLEKRAS